MALTAQKVQALTDKGFPKLFTDHKNLWKAKAQEAYDYTAKFVRLTGQPVRPDDVLPILEPALELSQEFSDFREANRLTQKYWRTYFGDFVLDSLWDQLEATKKTN